MTLSHRRDKANADESVTPPPLPEVKRRVNYHRLICNHYSSLELSLLIAWVKKPLISGKGAGGLRAPLSVSPIQSRLKAGGKWCQEKGAGSVCPWYPEALWSLTGLSGLTSDGGAGEVIPLQKRTPGHFHYSWCIPPIFHRHQGRFSHSWHENRQVESFWFGLPSFFPREAASSGLHDNWISRMESSTYFSIRDVYRQRDFSGVDLQLSPFFLPLS